MGRWKYTLLGLALIGACAGETEPPPEPTPAPTPTPPLVKPTEFRVTMDRVGPLTKDVAPTMDAVDGVLNRFYKVAPAIGGLAGAKVAVTFDGEVIAQVTPDDKGRIKHIYTNSSFVTFPWETKVGSVIGKHKHWERMACELGEAPFEGRAVCKAFKAGRLSYLVDVGESLPTKSAVAAKKISGMLWTPTHGDK